MLRSLFALALLAAPASAADMVLKAPVAPRSAACTLTSCIGLFAGGTISQAGGNFDVLGTGITGIAQNGLGLGGQVGYEFFSNQFYGAALFHVESDVDLNSVPGARFTDRLTFGGCVRAGYSLAGLLGSTTSGTGASVPALPQALLSSLMTPYVNVCEDKRHGQAAIATGAGVEALIAADTLGRSAWTLNVDYLHYSYNQGGTAGSLAGMPIAQSTDNVVKASLNYHFGIGR